MNGVVSGGWNINRFPHGQITFFHQLRGMYYSAVYDVQGTSKTGRTICHQNELCGLQKIIRRFAQRGVLSNFPLMCLFCVCVIFNFRSLLFDGRTSRGSLITGVVSWQWKPFFARNNMAHDTNAGPPREESYPDLQPFAGQLFCKSVAVLKMTCVWVYNANARINEEEEKRNRNARTKSKHYHLYSSKSFYFFSFVKS